MGTKIIKNCDISKQKRAIIQNKPYCKNSYNKCKKSRKSGRIFYSQTTGRQVFNLLAMPTFVTVAVAVIAASVLEFSARALAARHQSVATTYRQRGTSLFATAFAT